MAEHPSHEVVPLPVLRSSSIEDTLSGFADQIEQNTYLGRRVEHALTILVAEVRGWNLVRERLRENRAGALLRTTVGRALEAMESLGAAEVSIAGSTTQPTITAAFGDDNHALRAVVAAETARDAIGGMVHPSIDDRFHACVGVSTGTVIDTHVNGGGIEFQAS